MEEDADEWQGGTFDETDAIVLHRFFEKHADKVGKELLSLSKSSKEGEAAVIGGKKAWDTLCGALVEMGQPIEVPRLNNQHSTHPGPYLDFMSRNSDRSTESVREFFRELTVKVSLSCKPHLSLRYSQSYRMIRYFIYCLSVSWM